MLIVNADDLGRSRLDTDLALACHANARITSATAMVFMKDSERAADLAKFSGLDVGLHVNLCERFDGDHVPAKVREYQNRICGFLGKGRYALLVYNPFLRSQFRYVFEAQREEFLRLYGHPPSHLDGHMHMHLASNMLIDGIIPHGTKVRRSFTFFPGEKGIGNRFYRSIVDSWLGRRYRLANYFFPLPLNAEQFRRVVKLAYVANVELMTHPKVPEQYEYLMSDEYGQAISGVRLGSYASL